LNLKNYKKIIKISDKILLSPKSNIFTHAITKLHVLKEHPVWLDNIYEEKNKTSILLKKFIKYLGYLIFEKKNFYIPIKKKTKSEILIVSNLINPKHISLKTDFYFGDLENNLNIEGYKTLRVLRNFTNLNSSKLFDKKKNIALLTGCSNFVSEISYCYRIIHQYFFLKKNFFSKNNSNYYKNFISFNDLKSIISNLRISNQIKELIKIVQPKIIIIPYEGHAWERVLIKTVKNLNLNIKIIAYQFTVTTKLQHALFRQLKDDYNPDIIFTCGSITKNIFVKKYNCPVKILGSNKFSKFNFKHKPKKKINILVIPEGFLQETIFLFNFTKICAQKYSNYNFIFRLHPLLNLDLESSNNLNNIEFSNEGLEFDLKRCNFAFFRGTAAVFEAIFFGLKPIYIQKEKEFNINPIYKVFDRSLILNNPEKLKTIIKKHKSKNINLKLINYCNQYFKKLNYKYINSYIKSIYK